MGRRLTLLVMGAVLVTTTSVVAIASGGLAEAIGFVPTLLQPLTIAYTDWQGIKTSMGVPWLTSQAAIDVRIAFAQRLTQDHAAASAYALSRLSAHADMWGFDTTDLEWEVQITANGIPPSYLLKLREGFDFAPLVARFEERGFSRTELYGEAVFSRGVDPSLDWLRTTELSIHNTAWLEEERLLILSSSFPVVELLLATAAGGFARLSDDAAAKALAAHLAEPLAAYLLFGGSTCLRFSPNPLLDLIGTPVGESALEDLRAWLDSGDPLFAYEALGVAYRHDEQRPVGAIAFVYADAVDAEHDLEPRRLLAEFGTCARWEAPIAETCFVLEDAWVEETAILFTVRPVNDQPRRLLQMVLYADAPFAACR